MDNELVYQRSKIILGDKKIEQIKKSHVLICGIGGVGSYTLEALARIGVGKITMIDKDVVDITNINRQLIALQTTVGKVKVEEARKRVQDINSAIEVIAIQKNITSENVQELIPKETSYVVDCVDNVEAKIAIISYCQQYKMQCISCMGMGNKINPLDIKVDDIYHTSVCPLAKIMRKRLKEANVMSQKVVYSTEVPKVNKEVNQQALGSVSFVPSVAGLVIASEVVKDLIEV